MREFHRLAAAMDLRIQQLTAEGVHGAAVIERMVGHLPDLHRIWVGTSDHQLATLCNCHRQLKNPHFASLENSPG